MDDIGERLLEMQKIDGELVEIERQLKAYPKRIEAVELNASRAHENMAAAKEELKVACAGRALQENEIALKQENVKKFLNEQMKVKTNKEYQAITHQIGTLKEAVSDQETEVLVMLESEESVEARIDTLSEEVEHADREAGQEKSRLQGLESEKRDRKKGLEQERATYLAKIPEDVAEEYEILLDRFPGNAVVAIIGETCGGCNMNLLASTLQQIKESGTLVPCSHCKRLLFRRSQS